MTKQPSTYLDHAIATAEAEAQARFKKQNPTSIVGVSQYPPQPTSSPWHNDPVPPEPPLEIDIEFVGDLGGASPVLPSVEIATPDRGGSSSTSDDPPPFIRRRI
jgi:hypothetical protein